MYAHYNINNLLNIFHLQIFIDLVNELIEVNAKHQNTKKDPSKDWLEGTNAYVGDKVRSY